MYKIFVDFEMQPVDEVRYPREYEVCHMEIIEIGAVALDEKNEEISSFKRYIHPRFSDEIDAHIKDLTGITTNRLKRAPDFVRGLRDFLEWCGHYKDYMVYAWSNNDKLQMDKELEQKHLPRGEDVEYLLSHWKDFQKQYGRLVHVHHSLALENALIYAGEVFEGQAHDALTDAKNTAHLYVISRNEKEFQKRVAHIKELARNKEPVTYSIGSSVDFKKILKNAK